MERLSRKPAEDILYMACELWAYMLGEWPSMSEEEQEAIRSCIDGLFSAATTLQAVTPLYLSDEAMQLIHDLAQSKSRFADVRDAITIGTNALRQCDALSQALSERPAC